MPLIIVSFVIAILVVWVGYKRPGAHLWKVTDLIYYPMGMLAVVLLYFSNASERYVAQLNYDLTHNSVELNRIIHIVPGSEPEIDQKTYVAMQAAIKVFPFRTHQNCPVADVSALSARGGTDTDARCAIATQLGPVVEQMYSVKRNEQVMESFEIPSSGLKRCQDLLVLADSAGQANFGFSAFLEILRPVIRDCASYPALLSENEERLRSRINADMQALAAAKTRQESGQSVFWKLISYDVWPYIIIIALGLKLGRAVAQMTRESKHA